SDRARSLCTSPATSATVWPWRMVYGRSRSGGRPGALVAHLERPFLDTSPLDPRRLVVQDGLALWAKLRLEVGPESVELLLESHFVFLRSFRSDDQFEAPTTRKTSARLHADSLQRLSRCPLRRV